MIRKVDLQDACSIAAIYNEYVLHTTISFETEPIGEEEMKRRIEAITAARFPYLVCEVDGQVVGFCYAHAWKEREAYLHTVETTVYLASAYTGKRLGRQLMCRLIGECRADGYHALIACITTDNQTSIALHRQLGFKQVSCFEQVGRKFNQWLGVVDYELLLV